MTPRSAAADDGALRGFVFALVAGAGREGRISNQAERLWSDFARLHGARVVRAASAEVDADLVTHLVFMTPPASEAKLRETLAALPLACRLPTRPPPALLHKAWFVESLRARTALDLAPFAVVPRAPLTTVQPEATRPMDAESPAIASKRTPDASPARPRPPSRACRRARRGDARHERPPRANLATRRRRLRRRVLPRRALSRARVRPRTRRLP